MFTYPKPRRDESVVEEHFGVSVPDPYRWMEDPDSEETKKYVDDLNQVSRPYISSYENREKMTKQLTELWDYPKISVPSKKGDGKYYFSMNSGLQNQSVIYVQEDLQSEPKVFFDPNTLSEDGTISLARSSFSESGKLWAYGLSKSGSDWFDIHLRNLETGVDYPEVLTKVKFSSVAWTHDNQGIFYGCYPDHSADKATGTDTAKQANQKIYYHRVGTPQSEDVLCCEFPESPKSMIGIEVTHCGQYAVVTTHEECRDNLVYITDLTEILQAGISGKLPLTQVVYQLKHDYHYITNTGSRFYFQTNAGAPNYQMVTFDFLADKPADHMTRSDPWPMKTLVAEDERNVLEWAACVNKDKLVLCYMKDVKNVLDVHHLESGKKIYNVPLEVGSITGFSGKEKHDEMFFTFSSMVIPSTSFRLDLTQEKPEAKVFKETAIKGFDSADYSVEQVFYPSKDGTKIPMFIAYRKDFKKDGSMPCMLYGYGGFNISLTPYFAISKLFFVQHFGCLAIPNIRGGGEYGENWHNSGRLLNKQNGFDDFVSAAEYLINEKFTNSQKLCIRGGSNGGLLVGACVNQRPDLFGAAEAAVGVLDMLRFHKFTIGHAWCSDFGDPDKEEDFHYIHKYSPLHNIRPPVKGGSYPAVLLTTADHDDRVVPSHTLKFIAELNHVMGGLEAQKHPLMARVDTKAGHGGGKPTKKVIEEIVDVYSFLAKAMDLTFIE